MGNRILICGLPNSGKTTFAKFLISLYDTYHKPYLWLNGDRIREEYKDWDFSIQGRQRQTNRMLELANNCTNKDVVIDYVCPLQIYREYLSPTHLVHINTNDYTPYLDTKKIFEPVLNPTITIEHKKDIKQAAKQLFDQLKI